MSDKQKRKMRELPKSRKEMQEKQLDTSKVISLYKIQKLLLSILV